MMEKIKKLREETGAGVMDARRALEEAGGDMAEAKKIVQAKGMIIADKKAGRKTGAGLLESYIHNGKIGVLLELRSETDFVAQSEIVRWLAHELALQIAASAPSDIPELLKQPYIKDESRTVDSLVKEAVARTGENIVVERFCRYEI